MGKTRKPDEVTTTTDKTKKNTPSPLQDNTVTEEKKHSSTSKKAGNGIDEGFAGKKTKNSEMGKAGKPDEVTKTADKIKKKNSEMGKAGKPDEVTKTADKIKKKNTPSQLQENTFAEEEKPSSTSKRAENAFDEISDGIKRKKSEIGKTGKPHEATKTADKTKKKKTPNQLDDNTVTEEEKPSSTSKKAGNEIDERFAGKKRKKSEMGKAGKPDEVTKMADKTKKKTQSQLQENSVAEEEKPSTSKKAGIGIDGIFVWERRKKSEMGKTGKPNEVTKMTDKRKKEKTPCRLQENNVAEEEKSSSTSKIASNEIDEIFVGKKRKKSEMGKTGIPDGVTKTTDKRMKKKTTCRLQENNVAEEEKSSSTSKKAGNEIDEIFAEKERKKFEMGNTGIPDGVTKTKQKKKNVKRKTDGLDVSEFAFPPSRPRKKTEDGLSIYTEEELGISNADAGNTPLCPFDCPCCF